MSLVAYDSSDESSENEEYETGEKIIAASDKSNDTIGIVAIQTSLKLSLPTPKVISHNRKNEEENDTTEDIKYFLDMLPKPKSSSSAENVEEDNYLLKKKIENQAIKPAKKQIVKISVPSLSKFKEENFEEENEKKPTKIVQSSQKGCGLFAILVPPNKEIVNNKILIPHTVKNMTTKASIQQSDTRKSNTSQINNSKIREPISNKSHNESSSDEEDAAENFFGLPMNKDIPDSSVSRLLDVELLSDNFIHRSNIKETSSRKHIEDYGVQNSSIISDILINDQLSNSSKTLISNVINLPKEEILLKNKAEVGPKLPVPEQEYNVDMEGNVAFDEKAIEYLCGKRGVKRKDKEIDQANIIEISGEDIKPDEREWMVKALTEEPVQRPVSMQSYGINSQSKKKHQITYLAHQAKAMELELKNQWSQNRMTRKQTKSKYGF